VAHKFHFVCETNDHGRTWQNVKTTRFQIMLSPSFSIPGNVLMVFGVRLWPGCWLIIIFCYFSCTPDLSISYYQWQVPRGFAASNFVVPCIVEEFEVDKQQQIEKDKTKNGNKSYVSMNEESNWISFSREFERQLVFFPSCHIRCQMTTRWIHSSVVDDANDVYHHI
jgi:hypothetical protein